MSAPLPNIAALFPAKTEPLYDPLVDGAPWEMEINGEHVTAYFLRDSDDSGRKPWDVLTRVDYKGVDIIGIITDKQKHDLHMQLIQLRLKDRDAATEDRYEMARLFGGRA